MNIIFGLCGQGSRFRNAGYTVPKYLIAYHGAPMIYHAVETVKIPGKKYFVVREDHLQQYKFLEKMLLGLGDEIIVCKKETEGAAQSLLLAKDALDHSQPFLSINCDQYLRWNPWRFRDLLTANPNTSYILTYKETSPKCSYIRKDSTEKVVEVREKKVISDDATIGVYHWAKTSDFVQDAEQMIADGHKENGEYYVAPVYNYSIARGLIVDNFEVSKKEFWPVGTPDDLRVFLNNNKDLL